MAARTAVQPMMENGETEEISPESGLQLNNLKNYTKLFN